VDECGWLPYIINGFFIPGFNKFFIGIWMLIVADVSQTGFLYGAPGVNQPFIWKRLESITSRDLIYLSSGRMLTFARHS
jgi:hypothetical protein